MMKKLGLSIAMCCIGTWIMCDDVNGMTRRRGHLHGHNDCSNDAKNFIDTNSKIVEEARSDLQSFNKMISLLKENKQIGIYWEICEKHWDRTHRYGICCDGEQFYGAPFECYEYN